MSRRYASALPEQSFEPVEVSETEFAPQLPQRYDAAVTDWERVRCFERM